jgi:hypothetical protein
MLASNGWLKSISRIIFQTALLRYLPDVVLGDLEPEQVVFFRHRKRSEVGNE